MSIKRRKIEFRPVFRHALQFPRRIHWFLRLVGIVDAQIYNNMVHGALTMYIGSGDTMSCIKIVSAINGNRASYV